MNGTFMEALNESSPTAQFAFDIEANSNILKINKDSISKQEITAADHISCEILKHGKKPVVQAIARTLKGCWEKLFQRIERM